MTHENMGCGDQNHLQLVCFKEVFTVKTFGSMLDVMEEDLDVHPQKETGF